MEVEKVKSIMVDAIVLGRGPLGIYTSLVLIEKGYKVLNVDAGKQLKNLKSSLKVNSNIEWKTKVEAPSLNINGSNFHWGGGCMGWPLEDLESDYPEFGFDEKNFIKSNNRIEKYLEIDDFDFLKNHPNSFYEDDFINTTIGDIRYTYLLKDIKFEKIISVLESNKNYEFKDGVIAKKISEIDDKLIIDFYLKKRNEYFQIKTEKLFICLGGVENSRILQNSENTLNLSKHHLLRNLNDHLRLNIGEIKVNDINRFKKIFDKKKNFVGEKHLWPRYILHSKSNKSYSYFKDWRYNNLFIRRFTSQNFKNNIKTSGTCNLYLFVEKVNSKNTFIELENNINPDSFKVNFYLDRNEITKINEIINSYAENLIEDFVEYNLRFKKVKYLKTEKDISKVISSNHPSGTTPMGKVSTNSIVNHKSQLWENNDIYIFGSSTFTRPHYIHPTYPSLVFADYALSYLSDK